ncbi:MAG: hypothetical protein EOO09_18060 [Chitinophagaceae bacterium]|nr:MAG: hypothetical protein EOO09_18060 [Chitinophagaceae bacterium]
MKNSICRIVAFCSATAFLAVAIPSCKNEDKAETEAFFPVLSFIGSQVAMVDTSLNSILRITQVDSTRSDTVNIHREKFRENAAEFLNLPDLSEKKYRDRYRSSKQFDQGLNLVILTFEAIRPEKELIHTEQVTIMPSIGGDKVRNIIINLVSNSRDSSVQKRMLWNADQSFQVSTIKQLPGQPETSSSYKVTWNERKY